jgi:hypothetical protein
MSSSENEAEESDDLTKVLLKKVVTPKTSRSVRFVSLFLNF